MQELSPKERLEAVQVRVRQVVQERTRQVLQFRMLVAEQLLLERESVQPPLKAPPEPESRL